MKIDLSVEVGLHSGLASAYSVRALRVGQYVDQSSSRGLEKFGEDILISPKVIRAQTLNFKPNFKFSRLKLFLDDPVPVMVGASKAWSICNTAPPKGQNVVCRKMSAWVGQYEQLKCFCLWTKVHQIFSPNVKGVVVDEILFRFATCGSV